MIRSSLTLLALLCSVATPAFAETWRLAAGSESAREYVDVDSIVRDGDTVRFSRETRFPSLQSLESIPRFDRLLVHYSSHCGDRTLSRLHIIVKRGDEVVGTYQGDRQAEHAEPGSVAAGVLMAVCDDRWPDPNQ